MTQTQSGLAPVDPAAAVIVACGISDPAEARAVFDHAASCAAYHWVGADGFKPADVVRVMATVNATTERLVEVFGEERWRDIDEALFEATKALVDWSVARRAAALNARELVTVVGGGVMRPCSVPETAVPVDAFDHLATTVVH